MGRLIDTSIFIEAERERLDLQRFIAANSTDTFFMSVITVSELLHGVHRASAKYKQKRSIKVETWIREFTLIDIDEVVAREHARLYSGLKVAGQSVGVNDQWLAASCFAHDLTLVTANVNEFKRVSGLRVETWT